MASTETREEQNFQAPLEAKGETPASSPFGFFHKNTEKELEVRLGELTEGDLDALRLLVVEGQENGWDKGTLTLFAHKHVVNDRYARAGSDVFTLAPDRTEKLEVFERIASESTGLPSALPEDIKTGQFLDILANKETASAAAKARNRAERESIEAEKRSNASPLRRRRMLFWQGRNA